MIVILKPLSSEERLLRFFICCLKAKKLPYLKQRWEWDYKQNRKDLSISSSDDAKSWTKPVMAASQTNQRSLKQSVTNVTMIHLKRDGSRLFLRSGFSRIKKPRPFSYHRSQVRSFFSSSSSTFLTTRPMEWRRKKEGLTKNTSWLDKTGASRSKPCTCLEALAFFFSTVEDQVSVAKGGKIRRSWVRFEAKFFFTEVCQKVPLRLSFPSVSFLLCRLLRPVSGTFLIYRELIWCFSVTKRTK